jgi:hypothetical protein
MQILADFLNHGVLPFVGRGAERDRIVRFWRGTFDATGLRAMLMLGEAGIGKSRLLDDAMLRIVDAGGSVVHVKLYPESAVGLLALTARALWHPHAARALLAQEPSASLVDVAGALQRLSRLRPTLLVVEDLHLLAPDAVADFSRLLRQLADETLSLFLLARPMDLSARGTIEPYLVDEAVLGSLSESGCAEIWEVVTSAAIGDDVRAALHDATAGNPLALRSALRGALKGAGTDPANAASTWRTAKGRSVLVQTLQRAVGLLAEGMTADLEPAILAAARRVASLGEVFAREAAAIMLDGDEAALNTLLFSGIIATAVAPPAALPLEPSAHPPLAFTHTLLHRELVRSSRPDTVRLVRVVERAPLYSLLPFTLLAAGTVTSDLDMAAMRRSFNRTLQVEIAVQRSPMWRAADTIWRAAARLLETRLGEWSQPDWEEKIVRLAHHKINLVRRSNPGELEQWLDHLRWLSADASTDELALGRLHEIANRCLSPVGRDGDVVRRMWLEVQGLAAARPHIQETFPFIECIIALCIAAGDDEPMLRSLEEQTAAVLRSQTVSPRIRSAIETNVRPQFLRLFDDAAEVQTRLAFVDTIDEHVDRTDLGVWKFCMDFLSDAAFVDRYEEAIEAIVRSARDQGRMRAVLDLTIRHLALRAGRGDDPASLISAVTTLVESLPTPTDTDAVVDRLGRLVDAMLLRGDREGAGELVDRFSIDVATMSVDRRLLLGRGDVRSLAAEVARPPVTPILRLADVVAIHARIDVRERGLSAGESRVNAAELDSALAERIAEAVEWLLEAGRELHAFAVVLSDRARALLPQRRIGAWDRRARELASGGAAECGESNDDGPWKVTMLGAIGARRGEREPRLQGARARMLLGVMVANEMLDEPLSSAEFARLVAGDETMAIENARNIQKTTVHRVREALGQETVLTDRASPRLNPDLVEVDILKARQQVEAARTALRSTSPMQARAAILAALAIVRSDVAFPSLYDDFIEALREDFESQLRNTSIDVARALLREGGVADATEILRAASATLPGDGEISELLQEALEVMGRRADAVRVERLAGAE